ncbi:unnamed protein product [Oikopleura dioica]|uniref:Uncharacterized protein n=1 Tax=Oikopleura dioica TaxID=34765 RepID=E4YBB7_OIKDI|nr:unnamed protein product [Oikopleura dioica]
MGKMGSGKMGKMGNGVTCERMTRNDKTKAVLKAASASGDAKKNDEL